MEVRFKFSAYLYIEGKDMKEIKEKFQAMPLFSDEAINSFADFQDLLLVEDDDTHEDLMHEYMEC